MVKAFWERGFPILMHPAVWQAIFISYWSRWQVGWVLASWVFLVGLSGFLYYISLYAPHLLDILTLFRNRRQYLIFWQLLILLGLRGATVEPIITYWLDFFLWHTMVAWLGHWRWTFSLHAQGWAGLATFFLWYGRSYAVVAALCVGLWAIVAYQRWQTKAHTLSEVALGSVIGGVATVSYILV